ncbi:MAG TPA: TonB-dependent receptor [Steroidobacteraceae bacterium]|jgi:iron complex outermembrane receptor protein
MKSVRGCLAVAAILSLHVSGPTLAQEVIASNVETLVVTGARGEARTAEDSPTPIDVLSGTAINEANRGNLLDTLNTLLPSYNLPLETGDLNSMVRAGQLRGLDAGHTLVLVNGKRWHSTALLGAGGFGAAAPVDMALIPNGAIKRIEVLRDGAAAIYGSDAIAGVINIITDDNATGGDFSYSDGQYYEGDGRNRVMKGSVGFGLGDGGHLHLSTQYSHQDATNRTGPSRSSFLYYFPLDANGNEIVPAGNLSSNPTLPAGATPNPKEASRDNYAWKNRGIREYELTSGAADWSLPLGEDTEFYGFGLYSSRKAQAPQNFRHPARDEDVRAIYPDGYAPVELLDEDDYGVTLGLRGHVGAAWNWDLSSNRGRDNIDIDLLNSVNPTYGLNSQTDFYIGQLRYTAWTNNLDVNRGFDVSWLARPLQLSVGAEYRKEDYAVGPGDAQSYSYGGQPVLDGPRAGTALGRGLGGAQALPGFSPADAVDASRHSESAYVGVSLNPTTAWLVDLAGRYEDYSDFGNEVTGRLSTRYDFTDAIAVRATVSTGFQAPSLAATGYRRTTNGNYSTSHVLPPGSPEAIALGAKPLKPEKSTSYTLGTVLRPSQSLNIALDLYRIDVKGRTAQSTSFREDAYPGSGALVVAAGFGPEDSVSYFINAADTETTGVELTTEYASDFGSLGRVQWSLAVNHNEAKIKDIAPTPAVLADFNVPVFSTGSQNDLLYKSPKDKQVLGADWSRGAWRVNLRETHYGAIQRWGTPSPVPTTGPYAGQAEIPYGIGDTWLTDVEVGWQVTDHLSVSINANNVFDTRVVKLPQPLVPANMQYYYATGGPIDASGGFYSASVEFRW